VAYLSASDLQHKVDLFPELSQKPDIVADLVTIIHYIMPGYGLDDRGFGSRQGLGIFITTVSRPILGPTQPPVQWVPGALSFGVKRPVREADDSLHLVPRLRMRGAVSPLPQYVFMVWYLVKAQGKLHLYLYPACYEMLNRTSGLLL
jgi:hypothetical protein